LSALHQYHACTQISMIIRLGFFRRNHPAKRLIHLRGGQLPI
jgi:hypothetical protein